MIGICGHLVYRLGSILNLQASIVSILSLQASIVSVYGPLQLYFEPLKLLNPDPASKNIAYPNPQPCLYYFLFSSCLFRPWLHIKNPESKPELLFKRWDLESVVRLFFCPARSMRNALTRSRLRGNSTATIARAVACHSMTKLVSQSFLFFLDNCYFIFIST